MRKITLSAMFTALTAALAQVAIPLPFSPVPLTGQLFGVLLAGALLGSRAGFLSIVAYLLLGAAGAPVFSLGRGGLYLLTGPTGGYLWGFIPAVITTGIITERMKESSVYKTAAAMLIGLSLIYLAGGIQLGLVMRYNLLQVLTTGVLPFFLPDLLKVFLAATISIKIVDSLKRSGLGSMLEG